MEDNSVYFVEWKEEYVSQERGSRIVHYILKDSCGKSILAVVGTERSLRHMVYVVAEDFLSYSGSDNPIQAGFKWRSRREVVDWLTSMLAKQHQADSPSGDSTQSLGSSELFNAKNCSADKMDRRVRNLKQSYSDVMWLGAAWNCGKQLKHFPAFCRNGTTIGVQSFVFVMAKEGNRYVAYLEDMYEDKKGMKKVKVRWFHHSQEVKNIVRLRNAHPKEVYITPHTQVISVECVDGPAIVLTREHFEKCLEGLPDGVLGKLHLCCRQFRSNKIKPFDLRKLRGYYNQPIISYLESETFLNSDSVCRGVIGNRFKMLGFGDNVAKGTKRKRNCGVRESFLTNHTSMEGLERKISDSSDKRLLSVKNGESQQLHIQMFKVDDEVEILCQDSGIRGCWFRCIILEISRKQMKLQYRDLQDEDECGNLEEWVPAFRLAAPDKLGMRCPGRPTIRPCPPVTDSVDIEFEVGTPVDAWWSDGWWEGVVVAVKDATDDNVQVYTAGEKKFLDVTRKDLRISRDWLSGNWMDVRANPNILTVINTETKQLVVSTQRKDDNVEDFANEIKLDKNEDKVADLPAPALSVGHSEQVSSSDKDGQDDEHNVNEGKNDTSLQDMCCDDDDDQNVALMKDDDADESALKLKLEENEEKLADLPAPVSSAGHPEQVSSSDKEDQDNDHIINDESNGVIHQNMCCGGADQKEVESASEEMETAVQTDKPLIFTDKLVIAA